MLRNAQVNEHIQIGTIILYGSGDSAARLMAISVVGIISIDEHPRTAKVIMSSLAVSELGLTLSIFSIALIARGVAAFPTPNMFALTDAVISSIPTPVRDASGNANFISGDKSFDNLRISPASDNTFITPHHRHMIPSSESVTSTDLAAPSITALDS